MTDAALLRLLASLGADDLAFRAVLVLPLVPVAWAGGAVHPAERARVLAFAERCAPGREGLLLVDNWLRHRPTDAYVRRGAVALVALAGRTRAPLSLPASALTQVEEAAREVAKAHGGLFGFGAISRAEARALAALRDALRAPEPDDIDALAPPRPVTVVGSHREAGAVLVGEAGPEPIGPTGRVLGGRAARVYRDGERWYVEALHGPGLFVDGERVFRRRLLGGERLTAGEGAFTFALARRAPPRMLG